MNLEDLGWSNGFATAFSAFKEPSWIPGRVVSEHRGVRLLVTERGELPATLAGRLEHLAGSAADLPKIGDWVALLPLPGEAKGVIQQVLPRKTVLGRKVPGRVTEQQILAANVDITFIVQALDASFKVRRIERFLAVAHEGGARAAVILNKADLCPDPAPLIREVRQVTGDSPVLVTSAETGRGLKLLAKLICPRETVAFLGSSGVGKSSLINRLYGEDFQPTQEVRERDSKGRHTTAVRELLPLPGGGLVIDTPGLRELQLWITEEAMDASFQDISDLAVACRFRDCAHQEEPGCAVRTAVGEGLLPQSRYDSYQKLQREQQALTASRQSAPADRRRQAKNAPRALNNFKRRDWEEE